MMDDKIVRGSPGKGLSEIGLPIIPFTRIYSVQDSNLFVLYQVGIVCHAFRYGVLAFEKIQIEIIDANIYE